MNCNWVKKKILNIFKVDQNRINDILFCLGLCEIGSVRWVLHIYDLLLTFLFLLFFFFFVWERLGQRSLKKYYYISTYIMYAIVFLIVVLRYIKKKTFTTIRRFYNINMEQLRVAQIEGINRRNYSRCQNIYKYNNFIDIFVA